MVTTGNAGAFVCGNVGGGENILPDPFLVCIWGFTFEGVGEVNGAKAVGEVFLVEGLYVLEMQLKGLNEGVGQDSETVFFAFSVPDEDLAIVKVKVFDAQAHGLHEAQAAAIHDLGDEFVGPR